MPTIGKRIVDELYVHISALGQLSSHEHSAEVLRRLSQLHVDDAALINVAKINLRSKRVSLLHYPSFDDDAFPALHASWSFLSPDIDIPVFRSYKQSANPPILHRKELLVAEDHPNRVSWASLTEVAEGLGLFDSTKAIGFKLNWEQLISSKGFQLVGRTFLPLGNDVSPGESALLDEAAAISRHLTALSRTSISAPVQMLLRSGMLAPGRTFFDYGCGRGQDVEALRAIDIAANGWDPHFAPDEPLMAADVVNLGFVINVIEDPAERVEAVTRAFDLSNSVLAVSVMLYSNDISGIPYRDGYRTSRNTFQKYFLQQELRDYLEHVLHRNAFLVAPGIALVFTDSHLEQVFCLEKYRSKNVGRRANIAVRALSVPNPSQSVLATRRSKSDAFFDDHRPALERLWTRTLELGRYPEQYENANLPNELASDKEYRCAIRMLQVRFDQSVLKAAERIRCDDLRVFFAMQWFSKRQPYSDLDKTLQNDVRHFFGSYRDAQSAGLALLKSTNDPEVLFAACAEASAHGLGWLDRQNSLQLHATLVHRLPAPLRAYVACGLQLYGELGDSQIVKIHIRSGKLTLLEFDTFDDVPLPPLRRRVKVNIRKLDYDFFDYGSSEFPKPLLYRKSRYLNEEYPGYESQLDFDEALDATGLLDDSEFGPSAELLSSQLEAQRLAIEKCQLVRSNRIPRLDEKCGKSFCYRDFIECGETQAASGISNLPASGESYTALFELATYILDPVVDYFGAIRLTYAFSSNELTSRIGGRIAPKLDQHACHETTIKGKRICERDGAACDFLVEYEDMQIVANWIIENLPFDRLYYYGPDRPIHVSYGSAHSRAAYRLEPSAKGHLIPRPYSKRP